MSGSSTDLEQFHQFVARQLADGAPNLTPEDCLDAWRISHPLPDDLAESLKAIEEGIAQSRRGEGIPLDEFTRRFRAARGIE